MAKEFNKGFLKSGTIEDVNPNHSEDKIQVLIKASTEAIDKEGDRFLKSAWQNDEDISFFKSKGYVDWNHLSEILKANSLENPEAVAKSELARLKAVIGYPDPDKSLYWDGDALYCNAILDKKNEYVKSMLSLMNSGFDRFEASVAGAAFKPSDDTTKKYGPKTYDRARITHIAICPSNEAMNPETKVTLIKSTLRGLLMEEQGQEVPKGELINQFDPVREYILKSEGYQSFVAEQLATKFKKGELGSDYESVMGFLKKYEISKEDSVNAFKTLLLNEGQK